MPEFPWAAFIEAVKAKNQNQQDMMNTFGGALANTGQNIGQGIQQHRQKQQMDAARKQLIANNPQLSGVAQFINPENVGSFAGLMKPTVEKPEYAPIPGFLSKGHPVLYNKMDPYKTTILPMQGEATGGTNYANIREKQYGLQDLPSNQGPSTAGGAAYQVKVAARQGKNLIAKSGSSQRIGLASGDLARSVLRAAPTDEAMRNSNFSDNMINHWNQIKQKITSDPSAINNPAIRREMYNIFDEMDKSATPFIQNQLDDMESVGFTVPPEVRKRQLGLTLPDIPFIDIPEQPSPFQKPGTAGGLTPDEQAEYQRLDAKYGAKK